MSWHATSRPQKSAWLLHGLMLLAAMLVSTSFTVGKAIAAGMDPLLLTLFRFVIAALLFFPYVFKKYPNSRPSPQSLAGYAAISLALVGFFVLMFHSLRFTSALNTGVIFTLVPGISGIYARILLGERLGTPRIIALLLAMTGAIWVLFRGDIAQLLAMRLNRGDLIFFAGCLLMAFYTPLVRLFYQGEPMSVMTFWILVTGSGWLMLFAGPALLHTDWSAVVPATWFGIVYLALFCTVITFFLSQWATLFLGPTRVMAYSYLYPSGILLIEWGIGHPLPSSRVLPGIVLTIVAMLVVQRQADGSLFRAVRSSANS